MIISTALVSSNIWSTLVSYSRLFYLFIFLILRPINIAYGIISHGDISWVYLTLDEWRDDLDG